MDIVTGGTGLTGSHLLFELTKNGKPIRAIKRKGSSTEFVKKIFSLYTHNSESQYNQVEWLEADLLDYDSLVDAFKDIETVYHTGAVVSFNPKDSLSIAETNVMGTANVVDACLVNRVNTLCHVSSIAALGERNGNGVVDEACLWTKSKGQSAYAKSKFHGEMEVWRGAELGLRVIIVNPSVILGPGRWNTGSGQLFNRIAKGMPFYTDGVTGYVDVRDVARSMVELSADIQIKNERFIINADNLTYKEIFSTIAKNTNAKSPFIKIDKWLVSLVWPIIKIISTLTGKGAAVSKENLKSAFTKTYYSSDKLKNRLKFDFIPLTDSIKFISDIYIKKIL